MMKFRIVFTKPKEQFRDDYAPTHPLKKSLRSLVPHVVQFLKCTDANVPPDLHIHLIVDNYGTHKSQKVREWLARRPRYHVHYTQTYTSWLNQVEAWFGIIEQKAIRRGTFRSVIELLAQIACFVKEYNANCRPFAWHATADSILGKVARLCTTISDTEH